MTLRFLLLNMEKRANAALLFCGKGVSWILKSEILFYYAMQDAGLNGPTHMLEKSCLSLPDFLDIITPCGHCRAVGTPETSKIAARPWL